MHGVRDVDADPSDSVDQLLEAGEPRQDVSVDRHAGQLFDGLHHQVRSMEERLVDLPGSDARDGDVGVPRDPEDRDRALRGVDADDVERIAARRRGRLAGPCIAPDHQDEERSGGGQAGRAGGRADLRVQIAGGTGLGSARRRTRSTSDRPRRRSVNDPECSTGSSTPPSPIAVPRKRTDATAMNGRCPTRNRTPIVDGPGRTESIPRARPPIVSAARSRWTRGRVRNVKKDSSDGNRPPSHASGSTKPVEYSSVITRRTAWAAGRSRAGRTRRPVTRLPSTRRRSRVRWAF